jgi:hypothetical protein
MLRTVLEDIDKELEAIVIHPVNYETTSLTNMIYRIIDDSQRLRTELRRNTVKGMYSDLDKIRAHREVLEHNSDLTTLISLLFLSEDRDKITPLDRVFINAYYRRILRARIETDHIGRELPPGLIIIDYQSEHDQPLVEILRLLRLICRFLGIESTVHATTFPKEKLTYGKFWSNISHKFVPLFGENRLPVIKESEGTPGGLAVEGDMAGPMAKVYMFLNVLFRSWSGSILRAEKEIIRVEPAIYVQRLMPLINVEN